MGPYRSSSSNLPAIDRDAFPYIDQVKYLSQILKIKSCIQNWRSFLDLVNGALYKKGDISNITRRLQCKYHNVGVVPWAEVAFKTPFYLL